MRVASALKTGVGNVIAVSAVNRRGKEETLAKIEQVIRTAQMPADCEEECE